MKNRMLAAVVSIGIAWGALSAPAASAAGLLEDGAGPQATAASAVPVDTGSKKALEEVFDRLVVVPYQFKHKLYVNGRMTDWLADYQIVQRNERVLVPIRMMSDLATQSENGKSYWEAIWQQQKPDEVLLNNYALHKTITFTVGSKTMLVDKRPQAIETAPQKVEGRIVLPLREAANALGKQIDWLDGLLLIGDEPVDLKAPQTLTFKDQLKDRLLDPRQRVEDAKTDYPIAVSGATVYSYRLSYTDKGGVQALYSRTGKGKEVRVPLQGNPNLNSAKLIDGELYYATSVGSKARIDSYRLADGTTRTVGAIPDWKPDDGWVSDMRTIEGELYVVLHSGDYTMGSESLRKLDQGALKPITGAKEFIQYVKSGNQLYYSDFKPMFGSGGDNLTQLDLKTGKETAVGQPGFTYGVHVSVTAASVGYGSNSTMYVQDGYLYTLGFNGNVQGDDSKSAVYKIHLADMKQTKLSGPAKAFWVKNDRIYYVDDDTGYLKSTDLNGAGEKTLVGRTMYQVQLFNGSFYYTLNPAGGNSANGAGMLYRYDIAAGKEVKLSDRPVSSFYIGAAGIYYVTEGLDWGLYKVTADGGNVWLVKDRIASALLTDAGIVYTLTYQEGTYTAK